MNHDYQKIENNPAYDFDSCDAQCIICGLVRCDNDGFESGKYWTMNGRSITKIFISEPSCNEILMQQVIE